MGVYIQDMQMPKCCDECSIRHMTLSWCNIAKRSTSHSDSYKPLDQSRRPSWCPLVEVKAPHGRLVDADKIKATYGEWYTEEGTEEGFIGTIANLVDSIPAVIEEEDDDEEIQGCNEDGCPIFFGESSDEPEEGAEE